MYCTWDLMGAGQVLTESRKLFCLFGLLLITVWARARYSPAWFTC